MNKQLIIVGILVIFLTIRLSGCNESNTNETKINKEKILGIWLANATSGSGKGAIGTSTFFSNGTFFVSSDSKAWGTLKISDEKLTMSGDGRTFNYDYTFSDNNKVTLIDGYWTIILTRQ